MSSRRDFLKTSGVLVVSVGALRIADPLALIAQATGPYPDPDYLQLDSWIAIHQDNTATFYVGKTDCGQGTGTSFRQMMSDELDIAYDKTTCVMGSTDNTVDQGGSGGSDAIQTDGWPMRRVAADLIPVSPLNRIRTARALVLLALRRLLDLRLLRRHGDLLVGARVMRGGGWPAGRRRRSDDGVTVAPCAGTRAA